MHSVPTDLKYTNSHIWVEDLGENTYRVGITDFAQEQPQADLFNADPLLEKIKLIDPDSTNPKQALALLYELKAMLDR